MKPTRSSGPRSKTLLRKVTLAACWGHGLDGYDLGVLTALLPVITA